MSEPSKAAKDAAEIILGPEELRPGLLAEVARAIDTAMHSEREAAEGMFKSLDAVVKSALNAVVMAKCAETNPDWNENHRLEITFTMGELRSFVKALKAYREVRGEKVGGLAR